MQMSLKNRHHCVSWIDYGIIMLLVRKVMYNCFASCEDDFIVCGKSNDKYFGYEGCIEGSANIFQTYIPQA